MKVDECRATVFLHEPLRRSLAMWLGGKEVASMQRCALGVGHLVSEHLGVPDPAGRGCFRWDECGFHIGSAERRDYGSSRGGTLGSFWIQRERNFISDVSQSGGRRYVLDDNDLKIAAP